MADLQGNRRWTSDERKKLRKTPVHGAMSSAQRAWDRILRQAAGIEQDVRSNIGQGERNVRKSIGDTQRSLQSHERNARSLIGDIGTNLFGGGTSKRDAAAKTRAIRARNARAVGRGLKARNQASAARRTTTTPKTITPKKVTQTKTGRNKRTKAVGRAAAKVQARNTGLSRAEARAKARKIVKKRGGR